MPRAVTPPDNVQVIGRFVQQAAFAGDLRGFYFGNLHHDGARARNERRAASFSARLVRTDSMDGAPGVGELALPGPRLIQPAARRNMKILPVRVKSGKHVSTGHES